MAWVILRIVAEVAFSKAMQVGHPKTMEVYENAEACKVRGGILTTRGLLKTAGCERGEAGVCWTLKTGRVDGQNQGWEWPQKCPGTRCSENLGFCVLGVLVLSIPSRKGAPPRQCGTPRGRAS